MRRLLLALVVGFALLAGCAAPGATLPPGAPVNPPATDRSEQPSTNAPIPPGQSARVARSQIDDSALPGGYTEPMTVDPEGTQLTVTGVAGSCSTVAATLLGEDARSISVRLVTTRTSDGVCTAIAKLVPLTVQLAQPLGGRTVRLSGGS